MAKAQKGKIFCKRKGKGNYSPTFLAPTLPRGNLSVNKTASLGRVWGILQKAKKPLLAEKTDDLVPQAPEGHPQAQASRRSSQSVRVRAPSSILGLRVYDSNIYYTLFLNEPNPPVSINFTIPAYKVVRNFQREGFWPQFCSFVSTAPKSLDAFVFFIARKDVSRLQIEINKESTKSCILQASKRNKPGLHVELVAHTQHVGGAGSKGLHPRAHFLNHSSCV